MCLTMKMTVENNSGRETDNGKKIILLRISVNFNTTRLTMKKKNNHVAEQSQIVFRCGEVICTLRMVRIKISLFGVFLVHLYCIIIFHNEQ